MTSAQEQYTQLIQTPGRVDPSTLSAIFDQLDPIKPEQLLGDWNGGFFDTGHPVANTLKEINWVGKSFTSIDHVDPVVVEENGCRVSWGKWGFASVSLPEQSVHHTMPRQAIKS
ncbi:uncharacterized protein ACHE_70205S [Aspergillus chevalieri]|uniref:GXWXG domain-containing protein n=1 Tax=Aspergillus chevalieri TaxID=182096 RepID=A0A7R7VV39_ASPCH|nr:uncharacterized protein ACHE_70205S [Aspergillus chevalieri]BCR91362.1 hypothetical protein ACHE_70205S [Aspergillus chevalieri]